MACSITSISPTKKLPTDKPGIILDGKIVASTWLDGDTVRLQLDDTKKVTARLAGFNTLESYAAVHKWGAWTPNQLIDIARQATLRTKSETWHCKTLPGSGGYRRIKIDCPQLRHSLLRSGLAHVFTIGAKVDPTNLQTQNFAKSHGLGMWAKGVPSIIITHVRSKATPSPQERIYDTHVSTQTGEVQFRNHTLTYSPCQFVCTASSCFQFIPKHSRYHANPKTCHDPADPPLPTG